MAVLIATQVQATYIPRNGSKQEKPSHGEDSLTQAFRQTRMGIVQIPVQSSKQAGDSKDQSDYWYKAIEPATFSNWAVVLLGLIASFLAVRSLKVLERQGASMKTQVALMAHQWVDIENWSVYLIQAQPINLLQIRFEIFNNTAYPLNLVLVTAKVLQAATVLDNEVTVNPKGCFRVAVSLELSKDLERKYLSGRLLLPIRGTVSFRDVIRNEQDQDFMGAVGCGNGTVTTFIALKFVDSDQGESEKAV